MAEPIYTLSANTEPLIAYLKEITEELPACSAETAERVIRFVKGRLLCGGFIGVSTKRSVEWMPGEPNGLVVSIGPTVLGVDFLVALRAGYIDRFIQELESHG